MKRDRKCIAQLLYFSDLLSSKYPEDTANLISALKKHNVDHGFVKGAKDIRIRDFMPVQICNARYRNMVFRYEPSYLKNRRDEQTVFSKDIDKNWELVNGWRPPCDFDESEIRLDGGNIVVSPDKEKAIISDRIFPENPEYKSSELIRKLNSVLWRMQIIIIPSREDDITGHADNTVRFLDDRTVLCNEDLPSDGFGSRLRTMLEYHGLDVLEFPFAPTDKSGAVGNYLNYFETEEAVFLPVFGIDADERAVLTAEKLFSKPVEPVMIPNIAADGAGLHSISWGMSD